MHACVAMLVCTLNCNVDSIGQLETDNHCFCLKIYRTPRIEPPWWVRQSIVNIIDDDGASTEYMRSIYVCRM